MKEDKCWVMWHLWGVNLKEGDYSKDADVDGSIILKWILKYRVVRAWTGLMWLRMGTRGELL